MHSERVTLLLLRIPDVVLALLVTAPIIVIFSGWQELHSDVWEHLYQTVLFDLLINTVILLVGVAVGVTVLGVSLAWLVTMCEFPGRKLFEWAMLLPLAMPAYVLAFVSLGFFDFSGPLYWLVKEQFAWVDTWFDARSTVMVIVVMSLVFYPYVYMLARSAFLQQGSSVLEAARSLGLNPWIGFYRVAIPMARPAIVAGVSLALMETLADFGAVSVFNYNTFTVAIYKTWFGLFNLPAAAQLASILFIIVAFALLLERRTRSSVAYYRNLQPHQKVRFTLSTVKQWLVSGLFLLILSLAFLLPFIQLMVWSLSYEFSYSDFTHYIAHTLLLAAVAAILVVCTAFVLAKSRRSFHDRFTRRVIGGATLGYALPGSVLAVGIMLMFGWLDHWLIDTLSQWFGVQVQQLLLGSLAALLFAYIVRFMAVGFGPLDSALENIKPNIRDAARSLKAGMWARIRLIYWPMLRPGLITATLLVMVDVMKEMPATLLLRPFGWDTLAVKIYEFTAEGDWERAALPAVLLITVGIIPIIFLMRNNRYKSY